MPKQMLEVEVPEGYRAVKYGSPNVGDLYLDNNQQVKTILGYFAKAPRVILEKIEQKKPMTEETQEKPTVTVDCEIPEGFELQGEFRIPKEGDWYLSSGGDPMRFNRQYNPRLILKKKPVLQEVTLKLAPPEGFRFTGEYKVPETGNWYVSVLEENKAVQVKEGENLTYSRLILEKVDA